MKEEIEKLLAQVNDLKCKTAKDVEEARVNLLGKKGEITKLFEEFRGYAPEMKKEFPEMKKEFGRKLNELKQAATAKIEELRSQTVSDASPAGKADDLSMPGAPYALGSRHPVSIVRQEIVDIFRKFGYDVAEGPETIPQGICRTPSSYPPVIRILSCSAPTRHPCRFARWRT